MILALRVYLFSRIWEREKKGVQLEYSLFLVTGLRVAYHDPVWITDGGVAGRAAEVVKIVRRRERMWKQAEWGKKQKGNNN